MTMKTMKGLGALDCGGKAHGVANIPAMMRSGPSGGLGNDMMMGAAGRDWPNPVVGAGLGRLGSHEAEIEI